ncbi:low-density lipoprotein receptor class A domain-containing protein 2-like [Diadema antillarum]|uniref:low-density lipoprotein receptor class A domain-containing protein 2-like n=1 Tax=Diadema antillarum TaxID=105358 RepID=UPI003A8AE1BE
MKHQVQDYLLSDDGTCLVTEAGTDQYSKILESHSDQLALDLYNVTIDCTYLMQAVDPYTRVMVDFRWFDVSRRYSMDNTACTHASVTFFDGDSTSSSQLGSTLCGTDRPALILSSGSSLTMQTKASGSQSVVDFQAVFTAFSDDTACSSFTCTTTRRCIDSAVTCDNQGISNCGNEDYSDQTDVDCPVIYTTPDLRPLVYVAAVLALPLLFLTYWCCWRPGYLVWLCGCLRHRSCGDCGWLCPLRSRGLCRRICTCDRASKSNSVSDLRRSHGGGSQREIKLE